MIFVEHRAAHLFREDAYREYCWSVDAYGAYQPASFIYLSFEGLFDLIQEYGMKLFWNNLKNKEDNRDFPFKYERLGLNKPEKKHGLITRLTKKEEVDEIISELKRGVNIICLFPGEQINLWFNGDKNKFTEAKSAFGAVGFNDVPKEFYGFSSANSRITWKEIKTNYTGKLFVTKDSYLSDGFFKEGYGKDFNNDREINLLLSAFSSYKYSLLRFETIQKISHWPCNEPLRFTYNITNHGDGIESLKVSININDSFEPLCPTERIISLKHKENINIPVALIPRAIATGTQPIDINKISNNTKSIDIAVEKWKIDILPNDYNTIRQQSKKDSEKLELLLEVFSGREEYSDIKIITDLLKIDIHSCLNKLRSIAENLCKKILTKFKLNPNQTFVDSIRIIQTQKILSSRAIGYLHTVRVIGNLASHPSGNKLTEIDVMISSFALASIMEEVLQKEII